MEYSKPYLGKTVTVKIDRPLGAKHPKHGYIYPVNYGFIPHTAAPDGAELDAYILGVNEPIGEFTGNCIAIIHRVNDDDDKLIVCKPGVTLTDDEISKSVYFQEQWFDFEILRS